MCVLARNEGYGQDSLSSAEAPVSKHQRKKLERERWREKTGARGTMGRGKRLFAWFVNENSAEFAEKS